MGYVTQDKTIDKSMAKVCILDILSNANEEHPLTQKMIEEKLRNLYDIKVDRKTVHNHLIELIDSVDCIKYRIEKRTKDDEPFAKLTDFYIEKDDLFEESELQVLIYNVIFSKYLPTTNKKSLIERLESLSSSNIGRKLKNYLCETSVSRKVRNELFWNLDQLSEAITSKQKVSFEYATYSLETSIKARKITYTVSPFSIGIRHNRFVLIGFANGAEHEDPESMVLFFESLLSAAEDKQIFIATFALDRIHNIKILKEARDGIDLKKMPKFKGWKDGNLMIQDHLEQNPDINEGHPIKAQILLKTPTNKVIEDLVEQFGEDCISHTKNTHSSSSTRRDYIVTVNGFDTAIRDFVLTHIDTAVLLKPEKMRDDLMCAFENAIAWLGTTNARTALPKK